MNPPPHVPPPYRPPPAIDLTTLHIDADIIVADKPFGLLSVPGRGLEKAMCAQSILADRHGDVLTVHRLDMDTSGVMVFARSKAAQRALSRQFELRGTVKHYQAIVQGVIDGDEGIIDLPIAKLSLQRPFRHIDPDGQEAITKWQVLEHRPDTTRLELSPVTGRSHQLRLHLSASSHPILGDSLYGDASSAPRLLLHAMSLAFKHPSSERMACFQSPTPF